LSTPFKRGDRLVVASHNRHKLQELTELLRPFGMSVISAGQLGIAEPEESGATFEANAALKARTAALATGLPSLADDSGLVVEALDGEPGVFSARWAGPDKDFASAMESVERKLQARGAGAREARRARFVAALALALPDGTGEVFHGEIAGTLVWPPRGVNGFGYDPMFVPEGFDRTFGEMPAEDKRTISHRARAFAAFARARLQG
jgi:XTP/dITP diphosphohydrolase